MVWWLSDCNYSKGTCSANNGKSATIKIMNTFLVVLQANTGENPRNWKLAIQINWWIPSAHTLAISKQHIGEKQKTGKSARQIPCGRGCKHTNTQIQIQTHKYTNTNINTQIHKYKYNNFVC